MTKILLLLAVVVGFFWWLRGRNRQAARRAAPPPAAPRQPVAPQAMVACAHCGLNLPANEAAYDVGGHPYCGDAHRLAGPRA